MVTRRGAIQDTRQTDVLRQQQPHPDEETVRIWHRAAHQYTRYHKSYCTDAVASTEVIADKIEDIIDYTIQAALDWLEQYHGAHMRLQSVTCQPIIIYTQNSQLVSFAVTVVAEPLHGSIPKKGP